MAAIEQRLVDAVDGRTAVTLPVLGIRTRFVAATRELLAEVEHVFGGWHGLDAAGIGGPVQATVLIALHDVEEAPDATLFTRMPDRHRVVISSAGSIAMCDAMRAAATVVASRALFEERAVFRDELLRAITLALLTRLDRAPLHAAAIARGEYGIVVCGATGAGKSTVACAAACAGMRVLADDIVFLQSRPRLRVWAASDSLHLLPDAVQLFPQLPGAVDVVWRSGRRKLAVSLPRRPGTRPYLERCGVCVLGPRRAIPSIRRLAPLDAVAALDFDAPGFHAFNDRIPPLVEALAGNGAWLLHPAATPQQLVPFIETMIDQVARTAGLR